MCFVFPVFKFASFKLLRRISRLWLKPLICKKWKADKELLPLKHEHFEQYFWIHRASWLKLGKFPNLVNCKDFNDKIQWLKLFDQDPVIVGCVDKIAVRHEVLKRVGEKYLVSLYQTHKSFRDIDFDPLPKSFVVKANHDSGSYSLVGDKSKFDAVKSKAKIEAALIRPYGMKTGQWAYALVEPKVLVEEFIDPHHGESPPPDYKFFCVDGNVRFVQYIYDRSSGTKEQIIDVSGQTLDVHFDSNFQSCSGFNRPAEWEEMISVAERMGEGFKFVRVDLLYSSSGRFYVGEMTFWPLAGFYRSAGQEQLGEFLDFDRTTYRPPMPIKR